MTAKQHDLAARLAAESDAIEDAEAETGDAPLPANVKVTRGHSRTKVLQIRLNDTELAELERVATTRGLPPSTVAREAILRHLFPDEARQIDGERLAEELRRFVSDFMPADDEPKPAKPRKAATPRTGKYTKEVTARSIRAGQTVRLKAADGATTKKVRTR